MTSQMICCICCPDIFLVLMLCSRPSAVSGGAGFSSPVSTTTSSLVLPPAAIVFDLLRLLRRKFGSLSSLLALANPSSSSADCAVQAALPTSAIAAPAPWAEPPGSADLTLPWLLDRSIVCTVFCRARSCSLPVAVPAMTKFLVKVRFPASVPVPMRCRIAVSPLTAASTNGNDMDRMSVSSSDCSVDSSLVSDFAPDCDLGLGRPPRFARRAPLVCGAPAKCSRDVPCA
mmetsp:Transcript_15571/g.47459  ORF Transcript_15571/g.47459 Transcript_15571/m.47459 type:complete len:230 (+) Transcript_15571:1173-1862(+)